MIPGDRIHWGMAGAGITVALAALADAAGSQSGDIALYAAAALLVALALKLPQRGLFAIVRALEGQIRVARNEQDASLAVRLCQDGVAILSALPLRETGERAWSIVLASITAGLGQSEAVAIYEAQHRATIVHAVRAAMAAGARDKGSLQLAESPRSDVDLLELKAELLRMVVELTGASMTSSIQPS